MYQLIDWPYALIVFRDGNREIEKVKKNRNMYIKTKKINTIIKNKTN